MSSWLRRIVTALCVALFVIILPDVASAATAAPGASLYARASRSLVITCAADCWQDALTVHWNSPSGEPTTASFYSWSRTTVDPRTTLGTTDPTHAAFVAAAFPKSAAPTAVSAAGGDFASQAVGSGRYVSMFYDDGTTAQVLNVWDLGPAPAPTTTAAPSSSTPPASTTSAPATTSGTAAPTSGATGGGLSCTTSAPCIVQLADGAPVNFSGTVQSLTDEQWGDILLGLSCLVFFSAAAFILSLRRGR